MITTNSILNFMTQFVPYKALMTDRTLNVLLIGENNTGKSSFMLKVTGKELLKGYTARDSDCQQKFINTLSTTQGIITINTHVSTSRTVIIKDTKIDGVILMFSHGNMSSVSSIGPWLESIDENYADVPIIFVLGKIDITVRDTTVNSVICVSRDMSDIECIGISSLFDDNIEEPQLALIRLILDDPTLSIADKS